MLTCEYPPIGGGGATVCRLLGRAFAALGHEVDIVTAGMPGLPSTEAEDGARIHRVGGYRRRRHYSTAAEQATFLWPMYRAAASLLRRHRYDVIHSHFIVPTGWLGYRLSRRFGVPHAITAHGSDVPGYNPDRFGFLHSLLLPEWRRVLRQARWVTSPSHFLAELIGSQFPVPVAVIPNPFAFDRQLARPRRRLVLTVSRLVPRKGVQFLIEAMGGLPEGWELVVAGDGPSRAALEHQASGLPVRFTGFVSREEVAKLYAEAAIFVLPSLVENFPMVLLEAMNAGCAVITTDAYGCGELAGDAGVLVPPEDADSLRRALLRLIGDPAERERLGEVARQRAREFAPEKIAGRFLTLFEDSNGIGAARPSFRSEGAAVPRRVLSAAGCASRDESRGGDPKPAAVRDRERGRSPFPRS